MRQAHLKGGDCVGAVNLDLIASNPNSQLQHNLLPLNELASFKMACGERIVSFVCIRIMYGVAAEIDW
jgi:hypothetical protein